MAAKWANKTKSSEDFHEEQLSTTYVVFDPSQIHILGSNLILKNSKNLLKRKSQI